MSSIDPDNTSENASAVQFNEAIIIGAGISGIYLLHRLREIGINTKLFEAGAGPGGTWFWNRYPGCRFDSESYSYGYSFSKELLEEWDWSEHFASQPETLRYLNYVVDKFDLRKDMQFNSCVERCRFDDESGLWSVYLENGSIQKCRYLLTAIGILSAPTLPKINGIDDFSGVSFHTFNWPKEPFSFEGKKVGIIGTGSTGVQIITEIASQVAELKVFQRKPNWCAPLGNSPISAKEMSGIKSRYEEIFESCRRSPGGYLHAPVRKKVLEVPETERYAFWEEQYDARGFSLWYGNYIDIGIDEAANAEISKWVAQKIRERVKDPVVAERLVPKDHGFGTRRVVLENKYYEIYNKSNVELVDLNEQPIEAITPSGIKTSENDFDLDIIIYATGFDAITGAYDRIEFEGLNGVRLQDRWEGSPPTFLGLQTSGFPNLLMVSGPTGASVSANVPRGIESAVEFASDLISHMQENGFTRVEAKEEAEDKWGQHVREVSDGLLMTKTKSWFTGHNTNVAGRQQIRHLMYTGGAPKFRKKLADVKAMEFDGFRFQ